MDNLSLKIQAEFENIDEIITTIPFDKDILQITTLELAGIAAMIHSFYNGIEDILKLILRTREVELPSGEYWHKRLLEKSIEFNIISERNKNQLSPYLAFRHFFIHAYAFDLYSEKMEPLLFSLKNVYKDFKDSINRFY